MLVSVDRKCRWFSAASGALAQQLFAVEHLECRCLFREFASKLSRVRCRLGTFDFTRLRDM
jgi:hypothetical protein